MENTFLNATRGAQNQPASKVDIFQFHMEEAANSF